MKRVVVAALTASAIALLVFACDDGSYYDDGYGYASGRAACAQYDSCETCTPVLGCGWCFTSDGRGACHSGPDRCAGSAFGWTWETSGCRVSADASVVPSDASKAVDTGSSSPDGAPVASDSATGAPDAAPAVDAAPPAEDAAPASD